MDVQGALFTLFMVRKGRSTAQLPLHLPATWPASCLEGTNSYHLPYVIATTVWPIVTTWVNSKAFQCVQTCYNMHTYYHEFENAFK